MSTLQGASNNTVHYEDEGRGRPVVLIHGWPLSGQSWRGQVGPLVDSGFRVVTYDRRGFGRSDAPATGYGFDRLSDDLARLLDHLDLTDVTLVGFSMGGGEVARFIARHGEERLRSVVFASAVPPYMLHGSNNPKGPLTKGRAAKMAASLTANRDAFYDEFTTEFFTAGGALRVTDEQRREALAMCRQANKLAALEAMTAFGATDFRDDLTKITVPTLVIHGDGDLTVPFEGSGRRTHEAVNQSELALIPGGPHGVNVSHVEEFNRALLTFLKR